MEIFNFDIIGEDMLLYNLKNTYSAKVLSHDTKLLKINIEHFRKNFSKVLPAIEKLMKKRKEFVKMRIID